MPASDKRWDLLIRNAMVFDGSGGPGLREDVAVADGRIAARDSQLDSDAAHEVIDAEGQWLMPGLLDIHTHFDLEVEVEPHLPEAVRHGTTTVVMGNCSLGLAFGKQTQSDNPEDNPVISCFARVENMPKKMLAQAMQGRVHWDNTGDYISHFDDLALGPNVTALVPHSMLRIQVMGLERSIRGKASADEIRKMQALLQAAVDQGFVGMSTDELPLHYLANDPHRNIQVPSQFASYGEQKALARVLREHDRIWQATPNPDDRLGTFGTISLTSGRLHGKPLRMSYLAAVQLITDPKAHLDLFKISRLMNSRLMNGDLSFQTLAAPFMIYTDGVNSPIMEDPEPFRTLIAVDADDRAGRRKLLDDPAFIKRFRKAWYHDKKGFSPARIKRSLTGRAGGTFRRDLDGMEIISCPVPQWAGGTVDDAWQRLRRYQAGDTGVVRGDEEQGVFERAPARCDEADFVLHLLREFDLDLRWSVLTGNPDETELKRLLFHEHTVPGFNDSGAHLRNMAFYDGNLRTLKIAQKDSTARVAEAVKRLTRVPARLFGINAGTMEVGDRADLTVVDPEALRHYDPEAGRRMQWRDAFGMEQMINRSDGVVPAVIINGRLAWDGREYTPAFGRERFGSWLGYHRHAAHWSA